MDLYILSNVSIIFFKAGKRTSVENNKFIDFRLSAGTYSIDDFNKKSRKQSYNKDRAGNHLKLKT